MLLRVLFLATLMVFALNMQSDAAGLKAVSVVKVKLLRVFQTTGLGNKRVPLYRIDITSDSISNVFIEKLSLKINENTEHNVDAVQLYTTKTKEYYANQSPVFLGEIQANKGKLEIKCNRGSRVKPNQFLWLTCDVSNGARVGETVEAIVSSIILKVNGKRLKVNSSFADETVENQGLKIFKQQQFLFVPTTYNCRFYRIPAMVQTLDGSLVVAADRRYDYSGDLGEHKIDVAIRRSEDGGKSWSPQQIIATGDGQSVEAFGYGDAALAVANNGRLICLLSAGKNNFFRGMRHIGITTSDDGGISWTIPRELTAQNFTDEAHNLNDSIGFWSIFPTSGRGLTLPDGTIIFAANCIEHTDTYNIDCYMLYSKDNGVSWSIGKSCAYRGSDESKLQLMNDGKLLLSVRQDGNRGFNISSDDGKTWGEQWQTPDMPGNACNADMIYYSRETDGECDILLHTLISNTERSNLNLYRSTNKGASWQLLMNIQPGGAAYSTMLKLDNGDVAIFYEDDSYNADNGYHLNYIIVSKEQILN